MIAENIKLTAENYGEKSVILAKSGYGKSYTARVFIEEGLDLGVTFIVLDPQGAYGNLDGFDYIHFSQIRKPEDFARVIALSNKNIVINLQKSTIEEQNTFVNKFLKSFRKYRRKGIQHIVIDEIHKFAPEREKTESKSEVRAMFQEDRSDGQGITGISQRPARMDKTILSQADNIMLGRFKSKTDIDAVKVYVENDEDVEKIKKFAKGEFLVIGLNNDDSVIAKIRKANTEHSGGSPKHLLNEDANLYRQQVQGLVRKTKMTDNIETNNSTLNRVIPSREGFMDLFGLGAKVSLGALVGASISGVVANRMPVSPVPYVSSRTLGATGSMVGLYALWRMMPSRFARSKDVLKYSTAGSVAFWTGSAFYDVLNVVGVRLPAFGNYLVTATTGVIPMPTASKTSGEASSGAVDTNTGFA